MPSIKVLNQLGEEVKELNLSDEVFAIEPNMQAVVDVVNSQRAGMRQGTADTKNRTEVSGGGRKPYRQKGTGRARQGSIRSPQFVGGGVVFGPTPRKYVLKVNKKVVKLAVKSLLSDKLANNSLVVVDKFELAEAKTKLFVEVMNNIGAYVNKKIVVVTDEENFNLELAGRNVPNYYIQTKSHLSVYDLINADMYVMTEDAVKKYEEELK
ncbi:MAG: 50S ribosomal protein L4 [Bacilli bacterium]|jgi:large subunit ribosomal protein L4|nr:50S ribosomal protein L4 [Bacilli bacterium]